MRTITQQTWGKKALSILLTAAMVLTLLPMAAFPAYATTAEPFQVGSQTYRMLDEAVAAVPDGGTITMLDDVFTEDWSLYDYTTLPIVLNSNKSYTLDLGGFTLSSARGGVDELLSVNTMGGPAGTVTIKNGAVQFFESENSIRISDNANVILDGLADTSRVVVTTSSSTLSILSGEYTFHSLEGGGLNMMFGAATITSGTFTNLYQTPTFGTLTRRVTP